VRPVGVCQTSTPGFGLFQPPAVGLLAAVMVAALRTRDCNFNGVTPEMEETPVTDVTENGSHAGQSCRRLMSRCCAS
jgi:hypothetical protein